MVNKAEQYIKAKLDERRVAGNYRELKPESGLADLCSNDYLGFARSQVLKDMTSAELDKYPGATSGSAGSRLLAGNTNYAEALEKDIAGFHGYAAGLIFNSGYNANLGLFSSVPQRGDTIIIDELAHASIIDGCRLSHAERYKFRHNDMQSLQQKLAQAKGAIYIAVESVYSMDGDMAPLTALAEIAMAHNAHLIVDEAHAVGVFGRGLVHQLGLQDKVFAQVVTFGKALGCHGAIVLGSDLLRQYLINFSRSFIYTTAAPFHQLASVKMAYQLLNNANEQQHALQQHIQYFKQQFSHPKYRLIASDSAIKCLIVGNNHKARELASLLQGNGYDIRPILSPTVAAGSERLRICLHAFNTRQELDGILNIIRNFAA